MKIVFFSIILNQHQAPVADELWELTNQQYRFVELVNLEDNKGGTEDYSLRPYLLRVWESDENYQKAMELARTAECCVFSGVQALPFQKERIKLGLLSFDMSERWLKQGLKNVLSPAISKMFLAYWLGRWKNKPLYKLCCSAFAASDHKRLGMYKDKCYKWGYFTKVGKNDCGILVEASSNVTTSNITSLMWCSRFLMLKHSEMPIFLAEKLKRNGYRFHLDMYGSGELEEQAKKLTEILELRDYVTFYGAVPNEQIRAAMRRSDIFLFTSDRLEGWGAVANESLSSGCVLVASDAIGSTPYLVQEGKTGFSFKSSKMTASFDKPDANALQSLYEKIVWLLEHPSVRVMMQENAAQSMHDVWSPGNAANNLLRLIDDLKNERETIMQEGPCSKA